jgi:hypothetical protein
MKAQSLSGLQVAFHDHLLNRPSDFAQEVVDGGRITIEHRLHIYHNAYRARLLENLQDAYEKTWAYLGDETFETTARAYIEVTPPNHRNLRWYGATFPDWLAGQFPDDGDVAELAMVDWQLRKAFDGPDATPIGADKLTGLAPTEWETIGFQLTPTLHISPLLYNSVPIWHAIDQEQTPPASEKLAEPSWLLIWRKGWQPHFRTIGAVENAALQQLQKGTPFSEVCTALTNQFSETEAATVAAESLLVWLHDELIVGLTGVTNKPGKPE